MQKTEKPKNGFIRNILIFIFPLVLMVVVNEFYRTKLDENSYKNHGIETINPATRELNACTWACHNDTAYCKNHHVKLNSAYISMTDPIYFGMIVALNGFGNYALANIAILVLIIPLLIYTLLVKSLNLQDQISQLKKS